ncbi:lipopolysaccharide biosynthesis protein [Maribacter sp. R77961]|uniref:lipopolysaccharide biosynthesis protein n=1 Tax=Maribacter sp. R77961 TaxID=3093871 RepID=UPI0037C98C19
MIKKEKAIGGVIWSFVDSIANQGVLFLIGIILANILSPYEFGIIGILTIIIAISQSLIDSGFSTALIRKLDCSQNDYSTVFFFNITVAVVIYILLFVFAERIAVFFEIKELKLLTRVLGLGVVINAFSLIQKTILTKEINFKQQAKVSIFSSVISGVVAIYMAYSGYGVWSLVALTLLRFVLSALLFWIWSKWRPSFIFNIKSFTELFSFGSKLLVSGLIDTIYQNIYLLIIGKYFSPVQLGYFTRAIQFQELPSKNLQGIISRVSYPVLATMQNDEAKLKKSYQQLIKSTMLVTFTLMFGMIVVAKSMILVLIGEEWLPVVPFLQLLCLSGMFYPLQSLNLNILNIKGRSDLYLKLEIIKKTMAVPVIIFGILYGIEVMIIGMIISSFVSYYINSYWSGKMINYSFLEQIKDLAPIFIVAVLVNTLVYAISLYLPLTAFYILIIQIGLGAFVTVVTYEITKHESYMFMKNEIVKKTLDGKLKR